LLNSPQDDHEAGDMEKRSIDRERAVVTDDQVAEIPQPGESPLDYPTPFVAPKNAAILWWCPAAVQAQVFQQEGQDKQLRFVEGLFSFGA
jgi:hypothetical protein